MTWIVWVLVGAVAYAAFVGLVARFCAINSRASVDEEDRC